MKFFYDKCGMKMNKSKTESVESGSGMKCNAQQTSRDEKWMQLLEEVLET